MTHNYALERPTFNENYRSPYVCMLQLHRKCGETLKERDKKRWEDFIVHFLDHGQLRVRSCRHLYLHFVHTFLILFTVHIRIHVYTPYRAVATTKPAWTTKVCMLLRNGYLYWKHCWHYKKWKSIEVLNPWPICMHKPLEKCTCYWLKYV